MTAHEVVIRFGRPFDIRTPDGSFLANVREVMVPFADRESAEAAQCEISVSVRPVHDAGAEDYRPVVPGEVVRERLEIKGGSRPSPCGRHGDWDCTACPPDPPKVIRSAL